MVIEPAAVSEPAAVTELVEVLVSLSNHRTVIEPVEMSKCRNIDNIFYFI